MAKLPLEVDKSQVVDPIREISESLQKIQNQTEEVNSGFKTTFDDSAKSIEKTNKALDGSVKTQAKTEASLKGIKDGFRAVDKEKKDAFDDAPVDDFRRSVENAGDSVEEVEDDLDDLDKKGGKVFDDLKDGVDEFGGGISEIGSGLVSGDGGGILGGLKSIAGGFGPIGIAAAATVGAVGAIGAKIFEIDQKFDALRGTVKQLFDTTEEEIDRIVVNVEAIAETFDEDVNEVLLSTNALAKEFGLTGEEASRLIASGFNSAANAQGDLLDGISEYSSQIRAAGGDAQDLFNILELSAQEGIFSDKGVDVVKEAGLRLREQGDATKDALANAFGGGFSEQLFSDLESGAITSIDAISLISEELGGLDEQSKEAQTVIADVFGGAGEDAGFRFLTLLKDINKEQDTQNKQLTEEQQRKEETLQANKRLAAAQNELSKAVGDSSKIGRIWIDIQTFFVEVLIAIVEGVEDVVDAFSSWENFIKAAGDVIIGFVEVFVDLEEGVDRQTSGWNELTEAEKKNVAVKREATLAIRNFGKESLVLVDSLNKQFEALAKGTLTDEKRLEVVEGLNQAYPEQIGNIDLLTASEEELLQVKNDIIRAELEADIARKKAFANRQLEFEIEKRRAELERGVSDNRREIIEQEIEFLDTKFRERIDLVEEEIKIQAGLEKRADEESLEQAELTEEEKNAIAQAGADKRKKITDDFNKAIQEILKRGEAAVLNDQTVSQEERLLRQRDFQREELRGLLENAKTLNEQLTGSRQLDQNVIDAFNRAEEALELDFQAKLEKIRRDAREKERAERLKFRADILAEKNTSFQIDQALLISQQDEELALIEQTQKDAGQKQADFERDKQIEILDVQLFYLDQKAALIEREKTLKLEAINQELDAIEGKEGAEFEFKRVNLERKKDLIDQESNAQAEQFEATRLNLENQLKALENIEGPTLGDAFQGINDAISEALNLDEAQIQAIVGAVKMVAEQIFNTIQESTQDQLDANQRVLDQLEEREDQVKESLDREIEAQNAGFANNVDGKKRELQEIQDAEREAQQQREELLKKQEQLDTISQTVSLITASANLYKSLSVLPLGLGIGIATLLTATMFGAFAAAKSKASSITSLEKGGHGDMHGTISGKRHRSGGEKFTDHIEVEEGESWSVFNRGASKKHGDLISEFTDAINRDNPEYFLPDADVPDVLIKKKNDYSSKKIEFGSLTISEEMKDYLKTLPEIKDSLDKKFSEPKIERETIGNKIVETKTMPNGSIIKINKQK